MHALWRFVAMRVANVHGSRSCDPALDQSSGALSVLLTQGSKIWQTNRLPFSKVLDAKEGHRLAVHFPPMGSISSLSTQHLRTVLPIATLMRL